MIRQLAHACFYSDNLPAMIDFFGRQLGFSVRFTLQDRHGVTFGYYFDCGNSTFIEVFDRALAIAEWGGDFAPANAGRYRHLCFEVTGLAETRNELAAHGILSTEPKTGLDGSVQSWITDPDGNEIELMEYTGRSLQLVGRGPNHA